jgi:hypothetical protein
LEPQQQSSDGGGDDGTAANDGGDYGTNHVRKIPWTTGTDVASTDAELKMGFGGDSYGGGYGGVGYTDLI